jgi:O-antigen/teichoic acid export membrane protein
MADAIKKIIAKLQEKLAQGSFARNVLVMLTGSAVGQLAGLLLSPVLTRIYSPEIFGIAGSFTAVISILAVIAALRYDMALTIERNHENSANLLAVCFITLFFTTALGYGLLLLLPDDMASSNFGSLMPYRFLLPVGFFCIGAYQVMVSYATRKNAYSIISRTKIYQGVVGPVSQIGFGMSGMGAWGMILGFIAGQSAGISTMFSHLIIRPRDTIQHINFRSIIAMAKRYSRFPLISSWSAIIGVTGTNSALLVIMPILYSNTIAGFIFLTDRIIGRPLLLISTSLLQVYMGEVAKVKMSSPQEMRHRFLQIIKYQFIIVLTWLSIINATAFYLIPIIFGNEWNAAVPYIHILSICYLLQMTIVPVMNTLQILEKQGLSAIWESGRLILVMGAFAASYIYGLSAIECLLAYSICQAVAQIALFGFIYHSIQKLQPA